MELPDFQMNVFEEKDGHSQEKLFSDYQIQQRFVCN